MTAEAKRTRRPETLLVGGLAACVSLVSFLIYFRHDAVLLYGDAVAHINIARRVFDSRTPGLLQLGTVWLPLPHLLMIPFVLSNWAWRSGVGGSIASLIAYAMAAAGVFRLVRGALSLEAEPDPASRIAAWLAALVFAANPNLIYLQSTAMTETLYLALFVWSLVFFSEFVRDAFDEDEPQPRHAGGLLKSGLCVSAAALTRYDGWALAIVLAVVAVGCAARVSETRLRNRLIGFTFLLATAPVLWLVYNGIIYRNPLEFANGPYSARAIEQRTADGGQPPHPGTHFLKVAGAYFLKSAELNVAEAKWQKIWVGLLLAGSLIAIPFGRRLRPLLLLWIPLGFYSLAVAYGGVPIFIPVWWPFSYYNVRYGLQLLPAFSVFIAGVTYFLIRFVPGTWGKMIVALPVIALIVASYAGIWRAQPVCVREAWVNSRSRIALETKLAAQLRQLPPDSALLMYLGDHVGAVQRAGIPLRRVIQEGNHRAWMQPSDPEGLWERALADPASYVQYVVAIDGDPVWKATQDTPMQAIAHIEVPDQRPVTIYQTYSAGR